MRRPVLAVWGVVVLALVPFVALTGTAQAEAPTGVGYWTRGQVSAGPLGPVVPAPPNVPEGGFYVAYDGNQAQAVSTIRYAIAEPTGGLLTLRFAPGSTTQTAMIDVCAVGGPWEPIVNGDIDEAPPRACELLKTNGSISDDGTSVTFVIPENAPVNAGSLEFYVVPAEMLTPFSLAFEAPGEDSFVPSGGGEFPDLEFDGADFGGGDAGGDGEAGSFGGSGGFDGGTDAGGGFPDGGDESFTAPGDAGGSFSAPPIEGGDFAAPATGAPGAARAAGGRSSGGTAGTQLTGVQPADVVVDDEQARTFAIVALVVIGAGLFWLSTRDAGARVPVGATAGRSAAAPATLPAATVVPDAPARGVGRFARPRVRPPLPL